ncbi:hypothetical protein Dimus_003078 [Dionaea muscipula]
MNYELGFGHSANDQLISSGCVSESGWTLYLDHSQYQYPSSSSLPPRFNHSKPACTKTAVQRDPEEEDMSMLSDASSGPPHDDLHHFQVADLNNDGVCCYADDDGYYYNNIDTTTNYKPTANSISSSSSAAGGGGGKRMKTKGRRRQKKPSQQSWLSWSSVLDDDTASSRPLFSNIKVKQESIKASFVDDCSSTQAFSTTADHFQGANILLMTGSGYLERDL